MVQEQRARAHVCSRSPARPGGEALDENLGLRGDAQPFHSYVLFVCVSALRLAVAGGAQKWAVFVRA